MDRFKQIETFVRVADAGSLAAAALEEGVSPVILGRRIDALEKRLGVKLMYRSTRRLVVSEEGGAFLERCRGLLIQWDQAENELSAGRRAINGHLIVSAPAAFGRKHVAPLAPAFLADKPELQVSFNLTDRVVALDTPSQMWSARWDRLYAAVPREDCTTLPAPTMSCRVTRNGISPSAILANSPALVIKKFSWQP